MKTKTKKTAADRAKADIKKYLGADVVHTATGYRAVIDIDGNPDNLYLLTYSGNGGNQDDLICAKTVRVKEQEYADQRMDDYYPGTYYDTVAAAIKRLLDIREGVDGCGKVAYIGNRHSHLQLTCWIGWIGWQRAGEVSLAGYAVVNGRRKWTKVRIKQGGILLELVRDLYAGVITHEVVLDWVRENDTTGKVEALLEAAK